MCSLGRNPSPLAGAVGHGYTRTLDHAQFRSAQAVERHQRHFIAYQLNIVINRTECSRADGRITSHVRTVVLLEVPIVVADHIDLLVQAGRSGRPALVVDLERIAATVAGGADPDTVDHEVVVAVQERTDHITIRVGHGIERDQRRCIEIIAQCAAEGFSAEAEWEQVFVLGADVCDLPVQAALEETVACVLRRDGLPGYGVHVIVEDVDRLEIDTGILIGVISTAVLRQQDPVRDIEVVEDVQVTF